MSPMRSRRPYKIDSWPEGSREGDIPYGAIWSDGSIYTVTLDPTADGYAIRTAAGPLFGVKAKSERFECRDA